MAVSQRRSEPEHGPRGESPPSTRATAVCWRSLMAACLITSIPIAIIYNLFLDRFIAGFTIGAIK